MMHNKVAELRSKNKTLSESQHIACDAKHTSSVAKQTKK